MRSYRTEQRKKLIAFLRAHPDRQFSARDILDSIPESGISLSAIYRNLAALEEGGLIVGSLREGCRERYYRCLLESACQDCIHLTCLKCGKTTHLNSHTAGRLIGRASDENGFQVDMAKTVIYGICKDCKK